MRLGSLLSFSKLCFEVVFQMPSHEKFGKEFFDSESARPSEGYHEYSFEKRYKYLNSICNLLIRYGNPRRVLDIGCAKGFLVWMFREHRCQAWGVDISNYAISCASDTVKPYLYRIDIDNENLPFPDNYFDAVTVIGTIEYFNNQ